MACKTTVLPGGAVLITCTRGRESPPCKENGCYSASVALCDWPLGGPKKGQTCSRPVCKQHCKPQKGRHSNGDSIDYCPTHDQMAKRPHVRCPKCLMVSFNPNDIEQRFCGLCKLFHADPEPPKPPADDHPF